MRLLVPVGNLDGFCQFAVLQRTGNLGRELARLLPGCCEVQVTVDHHGQRPDRLNEKNNGDGAYSPSHVVPKLHGTEADRLIFLEECKAADCVRREMCELSENH